MKRWQSSELSGLGWRLQSAVQHRFHALTSAFLAMFLPFLLFSMHCAVLRSPLPSGSPYFPLALAPCWSFLLGWFLKRQSLLSGSHVWPWVFVSVVISQGSHHKIPQTVGLKQQFIFSQFRGQKSKIGAGWAAGLVSSEASLLVVQEAISHCVLEWSSLCLGCLCPNHLFWWDFQYWVLGLQHRNLGLHSSVPNNVFFHSQQNASFSPGSLKILSS